MDLYHQDQNDKKHHLVKHSEIHLRGTGGFVNKTNQSNVPNQGISTVGIIFFSALGGFNWEWAVTIIKRIGDSFKGEAEPDEKVDR